MKRLRTIAFVMLAVLTFAHRPGWAAKSDESSPTPAPVSSYATSQTPSPEVLGYQPIPNNALPDVTLASAPMPTSAGQLPQAGMPTGPRSYNYTTWLVGQGPYTLGRDDVIRIQVRNQPDFSGDFIVGPDGYIQYNYLGDVPVLGMTKYEVEQLLTKLLEEYIRVPAVDIVILGYNSKAVYLIGEVNRPGKYLMRGDVIKLREAIIAAGLPTGTAALWRTHIVKPDLTKPRVRRVNLKRILYKGRLKDDIDLFPGEIVVVPSTVLSAVDRFLSQLLNPITRAAAAAALGAGL